MAGSNSLGGLTVEWVQHCRCNHSTKHHPHDITAWSTCTQQFHIIKYSIIHIHIQVLKSTTGTWYSYIYMDTRYSINCHPLANTSTYRLMHLAIYTIYSCGYLKHQPYLIIYCLLHRKHSIERRRSNKLQETVSKPF